MSKNKSEDLKDFSAEIKEQLERLALAQEFMESGEASGEVGKKSVTTVTARTEENKNIEFTVQDYSKSINIL